MTIASIARKRDRVSRYPFPFLKDVYRYSANVQPAHTVTGTAAGAWGERVVEITGEYREELAERERVLAQDPTRCQVLPHMRMAAWDALLTVLEQLTVEYPESMVLEQVDEDAWRWVNGVLGQEFFFVYGDDSTVPGGPLAFLGTQVQEDIVLLEDREEELWADAGVVTFAADWSFGFDVGMTFTEIHGPVPRVHSENIVPRAQSFIRRLQPGQNYRRTNWTLTVDGKLDTSTDSYPQWGRDRRTVAEGPLNEVGDRLFLRTEVQHLVRLPRTGVIMFLIHTYLLSFRELTAVPEWASTVRKVLTELPNDMAEYKGIERTRVPGISWLESQGF